MTAPALPASVRTTALAAALLLVLAASPAHARKAASRAQAAPAAATATSQSSARGDYIVAVVNSEPVTNREVNQRARTLAQQLAEARQPVPAHEALLQQALRETILKKAAIQSARNSILTVTDEELRLAEQTMARERGQSVPDFLARAAAERGITQTQLRKDISDQILLDRVREARSSAAAARVTDMEAGQWLRSEREKRGMPASGNTVRMLNLAQVLVAVPESASPDDARRLQQKAEEALGKIRAGQSFASVVRDYTDAAGRNTGGVMGLRPEAEYPAEFTEAVQNTPVGQSTALVRSSAGFHILKVLDRQQADPAFTVPETHARHILLRTGQNLGEQQAVARLADLRKKIEAGQLDFASAAREVSQDVSAAQGGDLGWASPGKFVPEFDDVLNTLQPGQISQPFASRFGVHLVQLLERRNLPMTHEQQLAAARAVLGQRKSAEALRDWQDQLRAEAYVEMREAPR